MIKSRHGRLSEQFGMEGNDRKGRLKEFARSMVLETTRLPLLPHMTLALKASGYISKDYLQRLELKQCRIADTLAFLAAWRIEDAAELGGACEPPPQVRGSLSSPTFVDLIEEPSKGSERTCIEV